MCRENTVMTGRSEAADIVECSEMDQEAKEDPSLHDRISERNKVGATNIIQKSHQRKYIL
jgi:hypothetical protein